MERKTITTLSQLRAGDRFSFNSKRLDVWQVMKEPGKNMVEVNQYENGAAKFKYNELKSGKTQVMFLRHTRPLPGDECFLEDLSEGDVFFKPDDIITEYVIIKKGKDYYKIGKVYEKYLHDDLDVDEYGGRLATVVFVRKAEEVKK